ncbi:hypothetical protein MCOR02_011917 [Pyricularia oryzae]|uniref:Small secreted protein n=1 Tax=Pyricularia oryzae TaxID=318829 RepID=A0A4P7NEK5_PYROR|nr:hypothetical protein MCOR02_011917 [Pyricularia oryzae]KAI6275036.1 hypothetical protein MCOR34_011454 [Pyricularia oryzae]KAI6446846.1 hypothetical protein MCOR17_010688 [Pyricularia oryzae]KAI6510868.1 hypothetical protein MCOR13_000791 [Pyricularia oryzae]KAI6562631.1 hypothetical protein MCOR04_009329 [Pyricularia oryzae]
MQFRQTILSLFLVFNLAQALPTSASTSVVDISKRANSKGGGGGKGGKGGVSAEVKGINKNIGIQKQEKQDAKAVSAAETGGKAQFGKAKGQLLDTIEKGEKVRANNQKLADKNNKPLVDGLKKVQGAQATEEKLAKSLQGGNSKTDKATLKTLQSDFSQGIKVNKENAALAKNGGKTGGKGGK